MFYKILLSILLAVFISACTTKPKDTADASGSGSSTTSDSGAEGTILETAGTGVVAGLGPRSPPDALDPGTATGSGDRLRCRFAGGA